LSPAAAEFEALPGAARAMLGALVLCNDAQVSHDEHGELVLLGDPTETALLESRSGQASTSRNFERGSCVSRECIRLGAQADEYRARSDRRCIQPCSKASRRIDRSRSSRERSTASSITLPPCGRSTVRSTSMHGAVASSMPTIGWPATVDGSSALHTASTTRRGPEMADHAELTTSRDGARRARTRRHDRPAAH
jgi:hypothetical protein